MRLRINLYAKIIPILYRHRILALIKEGLRNSDNRYKEKLYNKDTKTPKPFCFHLSIPSPRNLKDEHFVYERERQLSLIISTFDYEFLMYLYNGLLNIRTFDFEKGNTFRIGKIWLMPKREIREDEVVFKTLSPISIEDRDGKPLLPDEDLQKFNKEFYEIHQRIFKSLIGRKPRKKFQFEPIKIKKQVVKHKVSEFVSKTGKDKMMITCFEGVFKLKGDKEDLQFLYDNGIGLRTSQGFGMVEFT